MSDCNESSQNIFEELVSENAEKSELEQRTSTPTAQQPQKAPTFNATVQPLRCDQIRWFHATFEIAGEWSPTSNRTQTSRPSSKEQSLASKRHSFDSEKHTTNSSRERHRAKWQSFCGRDSLRLELAYRALHNIDVDEHLSTQVLPYHEELLCGEHIVHDNGTNVVVLEQLYDVNIVTMEARPIYWQEPPTPILRGTWFVRDSNEPLALDLALRIEAKHLEVFCGQRQPTLPVDISTGGRKPVLATINDHERKVEVRWHSVVDVAVYSTSVSATLWAFVPLVKKCTPLRRGFYNLALATDGDRAIGHLLFVIPGVGQKWHKFKQMQRITEMRAQIDRYYTQYFSEKHSKRVLMIPIEWRRELRLDGGSIQAITISDFDQWRQMINCTIMDILYYTSPLYLSEIFERCVITMNEHYRRFMRNNPTFTKTGGSVSLYGHSLGSVIAYDIVAQCTPNKIIKSFLNHEQRAHRCNAAHCLPVLDNVVCQMRETLYSNSTKLVFNVDQLFCVGSPLGVFLQMRQWKPEKIVPSKIRRLHNIFHPVDMIAYRLEPLVDRRYVRLQPVRIHWATHHPRAPCYEHIRPHLSPPNLSLLIQPGTPPDSDAEPETNALSITTTRLPSYTLRQRNDNTIASDNMPADMPRVHRTKHQNVRVSHSCTNLTHARVDEPANDVDALLASIPPERKLTHRLDYVLPQYRTEVNALSALSLSAHTSYWTSPETNVYVLQALYGYAHEHNNMPPDPPSALLFIGSIQHNLIAVTSAHSDASINASSGHCNKNHSTTEAEN